jgi:hypothetical protein
MFQKMANSIQIKIIVAITLAFMTILLVSMTFIGSGERKLAASIGEHRAQDFGRSYFDGINTMMLTGTMDQREVLRKKLLTQGDIRDIRIIHFPGRINSTPPESTPRTSLIKPPLPENRPPDSAKTSTAVSSPP